jgi:hypothetical protein
MNIGIITQDDVLVTPPAEGCLAGITMQRLIELIPEVSTRRFSEYCRSGTMLSVTAGPRVDCLMQPVFANQHRLCTGYTSMPGAMICSMQSSRHPCVACTMSPAVLQQRPQYHLGISYCRTHARCSTF